ncbi:hypothetical protein [Streptomyces sp. B15]|uniref:hypothetical protein n=1 Tax=Streptomyces sp. B15 TaxID=1537797 RepID=UPI001B37FA42|nr:hypothetical protein [Streptomyces sp. B15]MBQ1121898.1 hypothetical protein [Streptomyces sp. B15]
MKRHRGRGGEGLGYRDEDPRADRWHGALWMRVPTARGKGRARLGGVHALRQRQCMQHLRCQICGEETFGRSDERYLWLVAGSELLREGEESWSPPVHDSCAAEAVRYCPHLRKSHVATLVDTPRFWGVAGLVYDLQTLEPLPGDSEDGLMHISFADPLLRWTIAARVVVTLHGCTPVDLDDLVVAGV